MRNEFETRTSSRCHFRIAWRVVISGIVLCVGGAAVGWMGMGGNLDWAGTPGAIIDRFHGVAAYYNGAPGHIDGRTVTADGYNVGLRWQCVEFVKRYYLERFDHRMPDSRGHAKDFFNTRLKDGEMNAARGLVQYTNGGASIPEVEDIIVFAPWVLNPYGHVAIVSRVDDESVEIVQQNPGPLSSSRVVLTLAHEENGHVLVSSGRVLGGAVVGWLRHPAKAVR